MNVEKIDGFWRDRAASQFHFRVLLLLASVMWVALWLFGLGDRALSEPDEGRYAEVAREMWASGDWLTPRLDGFDFFDKPPLHYWASAIAYALFGATPFAARLWCALTGLLAMAATGWAGARLFGRDAGMCAALALGSSLLFVLGAHLNTLDMGVAAFLSVGMACFLVAQFDPFAAHRRVKLNTIMWLALALATLSKGLIGVVLPAGALTVYVLWSGDWAAIRRMSPWLGIAMLAVVAAPWFLLMCHAHADFFEYFFVRQHLTRFLTSADHRNKPVWFYIPVVMVGLFPWCVFLPWTRASWKHLDVHHAARRFLIAWAVVVFAFFTLSHSKLPFYILPAFPVLALWSGHEIMRLSEKALSHRLWYVVVLALVGIIAMRIAGARLDVAAKDDLLREGLESMTIAALIIQGAALLGVVLVHTKLRLLSIFALAFASLIAWQLSLHTVRNLTEFDSAQSAAALIKPYVKPATDVYVVQMDLRGLPFYVGHLVTVVDHDDDDLSHGVASRPGGYIGDISQFEQAWRSSADAVALMPAQDAADIAHHGLAFCVVGEETHGLLAIRHSDAAAHDGRPFTRCDNSH